ncbi:hypothetical protein BCR32DRAFT_295471 [Anaeromyces robustus]|uniref:Non-structural maintenance of chromosomes element 1 homolog n=1 Tax=Anaeromyces robustus TaxID=1754192 RepID=A0A1Y1WVZ3_9FUNG|nr:hypothetical protein BCR32DRAFT_295471 [Anaeromyces robustus]|eukprot:ORX77700.1 hypothetical protein BCR32DRAFT_295471 [Anaeromyces robustus]
MDSSQNRNYLNSLFIQAFMAKKILSIEETKTLYSKICDACEVIYSDNSFENFMKEIHNTLIKIDFDIKRIQSKSDGHFFYIWINLINDDFTQLSTQYTQNEIVIFKRILELIMENYSENYQLSSTDAIREISKLKYSFTKKDIEALLKRFQKDRWIMEKEGKYSLDIRSIAELSEYIKKNILNEDELIECPICLDYIFSNVERCSNPDCDYYLHTYCLAIKFGKNSYSKRCPKCKELWDIDENIISGEIEDEDNY